MLISHTNDTLDMHPATQPVIVQRVKPGALQSKLTEMGVYPGKTLEVLFKAPLGDPIAVDVEGYVLSLRLEEAAQIEVQSAPSMQVA